MKRFLLLAVLVLTGMVGTMAQTTVTFDFQNNPQGWAYNESWDDEQGDLTAPLTLDGVVLTAIQGDSYYPSCIQKDDTRGIVFFVRRNTSFKLAAPEGKALTTIEVTMQTGSFDLTPTTGVVADNVWTGNATEVTFASAAARYIWKIVVTLSDKNSETVEPAAETIDVEAADIAAFNAAEDGKIVKLTLVNARVNALMNSVYFVEDATGATELPRDLNLTVGDVLNGYIVGKKASEDIDFTFSNPVIEHKLVAVNATSAETFETSAGNMTGTDVTVAEAGQQDNFGRLMKLSDVTIEKVGVRHYAKAGDSQIEIYDGLGIYDYGYSGYPEKAKSITGVVYYNMVRWAIMPVSDEAIVAAQTEENTVFDFAQNNMGLSIGQNGTVDEQNAGNLAGVAVEREGVKLTFVNAPAMPTRYYTSNRGNHLQLIAGGQVRIAAPEGMAVTAINCKPNYTTNPATGATVYNVNWTVDSGEGTLSADKMSWTGNSTSVRFTATGATYLDSIIVTTAPADAQTVTATANPYGVMVESLAEFNALADGTLARLTLTDAVVTAGMVNKWGCYIQDATAGAHLYCTGIDLNAGDVVNGYLYVKKSKQTMGSRIAMTEETSADNLNIAEGGTYTPVEGTIAQVNVAENMNRVVCLNNVAVKGTSATAATVTDGEGSTIAINNPSTVAAPYVIQEDLSSVDYSSATVVGILYGASAKENKLYPLSIASTNTDGITTATATTTAVEIYTLQGVRTDRLQRGLNIVGGKKLIVR